jgi:hypothetical protein
MHYGVLVIIDPPDAVDHEAFKDAVETRLERFREQHYDWYQIGGRWTGHFDGYEPDHDPALLEPCELCGGTGDRATFRHEPTTDQHPTGCNGCAGTGRKQMWPTQWPFRVEDTIPVERLTAEHLEVYAVVTEHDWHGGEQYVPWAADGEKFQKLSLPPLAWLHQAQAGKIAVIVDCHN